VCHTGGLGFDHPLTLVYDLHEELRALHERVHTTARPSPWLGCPNFILVVRGNGFAELFIPQVKDSEISAKAAAPHASLTPVTHTPWASVVSTFAMRNAAELASRRALLNAVAPLLLAAGPLALRPADAFDNRLPPDDLELKYKSPRQPGPKPATIGPLDGGALRPCTDGKPHCFSSSPEVFDGEVYDSQLSGWLVEPFVYSKSRSDAFADVKAAIASYPPGQRGIDGGGFKIISEDPQAGFIYVQFESQRKGFIDDMEFLLAGQGVCNVRTSSRLGYLDMGVNAKRLNWFAERLGSTPGWKTRPLLKKGHEEYFSLNGVTDQDMMQPRL
jgi:uncharacterized protein (DUF1499 family)